MNNKKEYLFILQGDMTPFQRATIAKWILKKAVQLNIGMACNNTNGEELTYAEMMDRNNHPPEEV